jgi:hypothetical protein
MLLVNEVSSLTSQTIYNFNQQSSCIAEDTTNSILNSVQFSSFFPNSDSPGKERDSEMDLYYYNVHCLDTRTSLWLSADPAIGEYLPSVPINNETKKRNMITIRNILFQKICSKVKSSHLLSEI